MRSLTAALVLVTACTTTDGPAVPPSVPVGTAPAATRPVTAASPTVPSWSRIADIPTPRSEVAAVVLRDAIYVIGGFGGPSAVERYVPASAKWERQPDLPIGVDHPMAAAIDAGPHAGVYVMGGNSGGRPTARAFHLAPGASAWREIAAMPGPRSAGAAVGVPELGQGVPASIAKVYVVGGASASRLEPATLEYDPTTDIWRTRAAIPTPRDHLAAVRLGGVCAVGGRELSMARNLAALECYDPVADGWQRLPPAPTARGGVGAAVVEGTLFLIGGEQSQGTFKEVELYDSRTGRWTRGPDLPTPRHGIGVVGFGRAVYVMSGGPTPGGSQTAVCEVLTLR